MFNKFIKSVLKESGLENEGFVSKDKEIFSSPVKDFYKGFFFDKSHDCFKVELFIVPIYEPSSHITLTYGGRLRRRNRLTSFNWTKESDNVEIRDEVIHLLKESKKTLADINTPIGFYERFRDLDKENKSVDSKLHRNTMIYTLCYAGHSDCSKIIEEALQEWETSNRKHLPWMQEITTNLKKLRAVCGNESEKVKLFNEWKGYTVKNLRLEKYYLQ